MATPVIFVIEQLATTSFFGYIFGYQIFFQGLEFGYCVFLLSRQCGESRRFRTLKLSERVLPKCKLQSSKALLGEMNPSLKLCPVQNSVPTHSLTQPTSAKVPTINHDTSSK
jgi:hypothetical protein